MKKTFKLFIVLLTCVFLATGCGQKNVEGTLEEIMTNIYTEFNKLPEDQRPMLENVNILKQETESLDDLIEYTIGTKDIEYKEIYESRPMNGSIAYSVVLVRMNEGADIEAAKQAIKENVNPRKWFCVGVESEDVIVKSKGDLIILIMIAEENQRTLIEQGFDNL